MEGLSEEVHGAAQAEEGAEPGCGLYWSHKKTLAKELVADHPISPFGWSLPSRGGASFPGQALPLGQG